MSMNAAFSADDPRAVAALAGEPAVNRIIALGLAVIIGFFVFLCGWAAIAHLDSAATAFGLVAAEGDHKVVQHPDGGVVQAILVNEGDFVRQGQVLIRLDPVQARAALGIETSAVDTLTATVARLQAEEFAAPRIIFPASLTDRAADPDVARIIDTQVQAFQAHLSAQSGQGGQLDAQIAQARSLAEGYRGQIAAVDEQASMIQDELAGMKKLYGSGYATKPQLLALERTAAALEGQKKDFQANLERLGYSQTQLSVQHGQLSRDRMATASEQVQDAQAKLADAIERQAAAQAVVDHTVIRAPVDGYVFSMSANTIGGVIARGQAILEIVPKDAAPIAEARLKPADGAYVRKGMKVKVKVMSSGGRTMPTLDGVVQSRSVDLVSDPHTGVAYYKVDVAVDRDEMRGHHVALDVGTPIEVIVPTGSRSALFYFFQPLMESLSHGFKEQ